MIRSRLALMLAALALTAGLGACERKGPGALLDAAQDPTHAQSGYLSPPQVTAVISQAGGVTIEGTASPEARIRGVTPDRRGYGATAGRNGRFSLEAPTSTSPLLIAISEEGAGHALQSDGWLFVPPDAPGHAVVLRAGAPSRPFASGVGLIASTDFDAAGGGALSGVTAPRGQVDISVDGGAVTHLQADAHGVFSLRLGGDKPLSAGGHAIRVTAGGHTLDKTLNFTSGQTTQTFNAVREADGWRVAWAMPGGGVQTTFILTGVLNGAHS